MGQYYYVVNIDKREFLHAHKFRDGLKLLEFGMSSGGTMTGLALLLADGNGRGGGDAKPHPLIGRWAGDRIVIAGDYADPGRFVPDDIPHEEEGPSNLYHVASSSFTDISESVAKLVAREL